MNAGYVMQRSHEAVQALMSSKDLIARRQDARASLAFLLTVVDRTENHYRDAVRCFYDLMGENEIDRHGDAIELGLAIASYSWHETFGSDTADHIADSLRERVAKLNRHGD